MRRSESTFVALRGGRVVGVGENACSVWPAPVCTFGDGSVAPADESLLKLYRAPSAASAGRLFREEAESERLFLRVDPDCLFHVGGLTETFAREPDGLLKPCVVTTLPPSTPTAAMTESSEDGDAKSDDGDAKSDDGDASDASDAKTNDEDVYRACELETKASIARDASGVLAPPLTAMAQVFFRDAVTFQRLVQSLAAAPSWTALRVLAFALTTQIQLGLGVLADRVLHEDLHWENALVRAATGSAAMIDFGLARTVAAAVREGPRSIRWGHVPLEMAFARTAKTLDAARADAPRAVQRLVDDEIDATTFEWMTTVQFKTPYQRARESGPALFDALAAASSKPSFHARLRVHLLNAFETFAALAPAAPAAPMAVAPAAAPKIPSNVPPSVAARMAAAAAARAASSSSSSSAPANTAAYELFLRLEASTADQFRFMIDLTCADLGDARYAGEHREAYVAVANELRRVARLCCHPNLFERPRPELVYRHLVDRVLLAHRVCDPEEFFALRASPFACDALFVAADAPPVDAASGPVLIHKAVADASRPMLDVDRDRLGDASSLARTNRAVFVLQLERGRRNLEDPSADWW